jgi:pyruvate kinase
MRRTKIVATIGPACRDPETLTRMVEAGLDVARLNFSHASREIHAENAERIRAAASRVGRQVAILQDLPGPKLRIGAIRDGIADLKPGERLLLLAGSDIEGDDTQMAVSWAGFANAVDPEDVVYLADGAIRLRVKEVRVGDGEVETMVEIGGSVATRQGLNIPGSTRGLDAVPAEDLEMLRFGESIGVDMVALSFVRAAEDITAVRKHTRLPLIAKIEKPQAVDGAEEIIRTADCVMVARGDLGIELPVEDVPMVQKQLLRIAGRLARPSITATQMLDSMVSSSRPTRAEVADVANAILDGSDAVMLSQETAIGAYPVGAVAMMASIAERTERALPYRDWNENRVRRDARGRLQRLCGGEGSAPRGDRHPDAVGPLGAPDLGAPAGGPDVRAVTRTRDRPSLRVDVGRRGGLDAPARDHRGADRGRRASCGRARVGQVGRAGRDHRRLAERATGDDKPVTDSAGLGCATCALSQSGGRWSAHGRAASIWAASE